MKKTQVAGTAAQGAAVSTKEQDQIAPAVKKVVNSKAKAAFLEPLIAEGKYTQKELAEMALANFPTLTSVTIQTFLTDSKNPKYNKLSKLVVVGEGKKLAFAA